MYVKNTYESNQETPGFQDYHNIITDESPEMSNRKRVYSDMIARRQAKTNNPARKLQFEQFKGELLAEMVEEKEDALYDTWRAQEEGRASLANESTAFGASLTRSAIQDSILDQSKLTNGQSKYPTFGTPGQTNPNANSNPFVITRL